MKITENIYSQILRSMPIPCVDLLVTDMQGRVLMLNRKNYPARGQWWFPGGRVHHGELRENAAARKLKEECSLEPLEIKDMGTYDVILDEPETHSVYHSITTVFHMVVGQNNVKLDDQSSDYDWKPANEWAGEVQHSFLLKILDFCEMKLQS